jgi:pimeloyl-ACP methyl ester carboxylesterase
MSQARRTVAAPLAAVLLAGLGLLGLLGAYRREVRRKRSVLLGGGTILETGMGLVEYAESGSGAPVLSLHGAGGGYDQGLLIGRIVGGPYRWIAPSRFGYLRTPSNGDNSPAQQARFHAALLDSLDIKSAAVVAMSAGAQSAVEFARMYPDRCQALVLLSGASGAVRTASHEFSALQRMMLSVDPVMWAVVHGGRSYLASFLGATASARRNATPAELRILGELLDSLVPVSMRARGIADDLEALARFDPDLLNQVRVPTWIAHCTDDRLVPVAFAREAHRRIEGSHYIEYRTGGHLLLGHHREVSRDVQQFIDSYLHQ